VGIGELFRMESNVGLVLPRSGLVLYFFCGVRRYVALECGPAIEDLPNRLRCYIILSQAEARYGLICKSFPIGFSPVSRFIEHCTAVS
jgi:hypothetical protein